MKPRPDKKGKVIDVEIPLEIQRDPVALKAFLQDLYRKGYSTVRIPIPPEMQRDAAQRMAFYKALSGKVKSVRMVIPPGPAIHGTVQISTPSGPVPLPFSHAGIGLLKDAIAGHKSSAGGSRTVEKRFGSSGDRQKERALWQTEVERQYKRLRKSEPSKRPSHLLISNIVGSKLKVKPHTIRRYTRLPTA